MYKHASEEHHEEEGEENHADHEEESEHVFPLPQLMLVVGFTLMMTIDKVVFGNVKHRQNTTEESVDIEPTEK